MRPARPGPPHWAGPPPGRHFVAPLTHFVHFPLRSLGLTLSVRERLCGIPRTLCAPRAVLRRQLHKLIPKRARSSLCGTPHTGSCKGHPDPGSCTRAQVESDRGGVGVSSLNIRSGKASMWDVHSMHAHEGTSIYTYTNTNTNTNTYAYTW